MSFTFIVMQQYEVNHATVSCMQMFLASKLYLNENQVEFDHKLYGGHFF
jgi:hypothetical protein